MPYVCVDIAIYIW